MSWKLSTPPFLSHTHAHFHRFSLSTSQWTDGDGLSTDGLLFKFVIVDTATNLTVALSDYSTAPSLTNLLLSLDIIVEGVVSIAAIAKNQVGCEVPTAAVPVALTTPSLEDLSFELLGPRGRGRHGPSGEPASLTWLV